MKHILMRLAMYSCIALVPIGCGTRKVDMTKQSIESKDNSNISLNQSKETSQAIISQAEVLSVNNKSKHTTETVINIKFDKDTGKQIESTEITKIGIKTNNSQSYIKTITNNITKIKEDLKIVTITIKELKTDFKTKNTQTSNSKLYLMLLGLGVIGIIAVFVYKWLKERYKPTL